MERRMRVDMMMAKTTGPKVLMVEKMNRWGWGGVEWNGGRSEGGNPSIHPSIHHPTNESIHR